MRFLKLALAAGAVLAHHAAAQSNPQVSIEATAGAAKGFGGKTGDRDLGTLGAALYLGSRGSGDPFVRIGLDAISNGFGDKCEIDLSTGRCRPSFPDMIGFTVAYGRRRAAGPLTFDAFGGAGAYGGGWGGLAFTGGTGVRIRLIGPIGAIGVARVIVMPKGSGQTLSVVPLTVGLRIPH